MLERRALAGVAAVVAACAGATGAGAIEPYTATGNPFWVVDEVRAGVFKQAIDDAIHEGAVAPNLEILGGRFANLQNSELNVLIPRPHIGTTLTFGKTDEFYWGLTWDAKLFEKTFAEISFGGAAHDGPLHTFGEASYGCTVNFRESASLGYSITSQWRVMGTLDHMSNNGFCAPNRGLTNAGIRLGYMW
jgi:cob(I)alamin adenosyltransferase